MGKKVTQSSKVCEAWSMMDIRKEYIKMVAEGSPPQIPTLFLSYNEKPEGLFGSPTLGQLKYRIDSYNHFYEKPLKPSKSSLRL